MVTKNIFLSGVGVFMNADKKHFKVEIKIYNIEEDELYSFSTHTSQLE